MGEMQKPVNADAQKQLGDAFVLDMFNKQQEKHQELSKDAEIANLYAQLTAEREAREKAEDALTYYQRACEGLPDGWIETAMAGSVQNVRAERDEYKQRAEAAEARIKASQEQEPVAFMASNHLDGFIHKACGTDSMLARCSYRQLHTDYRPLYAEPIIPPEVAELQARIAELEKYAKRYQWLRKRQEFPEIFIGVDSINHIGKWALMEIEADVAIDAAMEKEQSK